MKKLLVVLIALALISCEKIRIIDDKADDFQMKKISIFETDSGSIHVYQCDVYTEYSHVSILDSVYNSEIIKRKVIVK